MSFWGVGMIAERLGVSVLELDCLSSYPSPLLTSCMSPGKLLRLSVSSFPHL